MNDNSDDGVLTPPRRGYSYTPSTPDSETEIISDEKTGWPGHRQSSYASYSKQDMEKAARVGSLLWDEDNKEEDDYLHNPTPHPFNTEKGVALPILASGTVQYDGERFNPFSLRGIATSTALFILVGGLFGIFAFWPIATYIEEINNPNKLVGWNYGGVKYVYSLFKQL